MQKFKLYYLILIIFTACGKAEYNPNQKFNSRSPKNINEKQIALLSNKTPGDTIRIAVSSDIHTHKNNGKAFVNYINSRNDFDFVVLNGDITNFGLLEEFEIVYSVFKNLTIPFITLIGNHDEIANGKAVYTRMFGEPDFSFNYGGVKFVCHDTNSREHSFNGSIPAMGWLKENLVLNQSNSAIVAISHVPPLDADFDQQLRPQYEQLMNTTPGLLASVHSHRHSESVYHTKENGIPFIITNTLLNSSFTVIEISNGKINTYPVHF